MASKRSLDSSGTHFSRHLRVALEVIFITMWLVRISSPCPLSKEQGEQARVGEEVGAVGEVGRVLGCMLSLGVTLGD